MRAVIFLSLFIIEYATAQNKGCQCCDTTFRQFDFWLGDWEVFDTSGIKVGTNIVVTMQDSCMLQENWESALGNYSGTSYNYYNSQDSMWHQTWVDNQGGSLELHGKLVSGNMILQSDLAKGKKFDFYYNRITWTPHENGSVSQVWEIIDKNNNVLKLLFNGLYIRKK